MRIFLVLPMDLSLPSSICGNSSQSWILKGTLWIPDSRPLSVDSGFPFVIHFLTESLGKFWVASNQTHLFFTRFFQGRVGI